MQKHNIYLTPLLPFQKKEINKAWNKIEKQLKKGAELHSECP